MVRGMAGKCPVCGLATDAPVCPRGGTILLPGQAICPTRGRMFPGPRGAGGGPGLPVDAGPRAPGDPPGDLHDARLAVPSLGHGVAGPDRGVAEEGVRRGPDPRAPRPAPEQLPGACGAPDPVPDPEEDGGRDVQVSAVRRVSGSRRGGVRELRGEVRMSGARAGTSLNTAHR